MGLACRYEVQPFLAPLPGVIETKDQSSALLCSTYLNRMFYFLNAQRIRHVLWIFWKCRFENMMFASEIWNTWKFLEKITLWKSWILVERIFLRKMKIDFWRNLLKCFVKIDFWEISNNFWEKLDFSEFKLWN